MAITETYVDPSIAGDSGTGTVGDPYGDLQYALNQVTRDSTNGDRFNIKAGTDEIVSSALSFATYGTPTNAAPAVFQGYTSAQGDGGIGGITASGSNVSIISGTPSLTFVDMHLHNTGTADIIAGGNYIQLINCELDNTTNSGLDAGFGCLALGCHLHNIGNMGIDFFTGEVAFCYFKNGTNDFVECIEVISNLRLNIHHNIFSLDGTSEVCDGTTAEEFSFCHNSCFSSGTANDALIITSTSGGEESVVCNNLFEGFSDWIIYTGGGDPNEPRAVILGNSGYNANDTGFVLGDTNITDNESLGATPFAKSGSDTYANRATYFAPVDTGEVFTPFGGMGNARGAIPQTAGGGGGGTSGRQALHAIEAGAV